MAVNMRRDGDVGFVEIDNPPVNAIGRDVREGLMSAVEWAASEKGLTRVVLTGKGRTFAAGGDAKEFDGPPIEPHLPDVCDAIEASDTPWIAAITGTALGGGLELALSCRARIAAPGVTLGMPEVSLGVVPGAGGTQRLPRVIGLKPALDLISTGRPTKAEAALETGLIDLIEEDPVAAALEYSLSPETTRVSELPGPAPDDTAIDAAQTMVARKMRGQIAPKEAIRLVALSTGMAFTEARADERETFLRLRQGDQARALRHLFFAERGARAPDDIAETAPAELGTVAVVGGGTMGAGIAYALLNAGLRVVLLEADEGGLDRARDNVERIIAASFDRGLIDDAGAEDRRDRSTFATDYDAAADATLAIEAAFESMDVKASVFKALDAALPQDAILATNTSYLDINEIAQHVGDPSRVLGLHFFAPAHIMKLLEIVRADATSRRALATGFDLAKRLRKIPVVAGVCDGFIGNRILSRYREAADNLLMDGATPWEVDEAMVEFGYAMGPYETQDLSGLDIAYANRRRLDETRDPDRRYIPIADRMVEEGRLGRKVGVGWYRYPGGGGKVEDPIVDDLIREEAHFAGVERREFSADEIRHRLLTTMINEAADILYEGIASSAADIDLVTHHGYGFPRWRGGLMHYADTLGANAVYDALGNLRVEDAALWHPSPLIEELVASGRKFSDVRIPLKP